MKFENLEQCNEAFIAGHLSNDWARSITINETTYNVHGNRFNDIIPTITEKKNYVVVFSNINEGKLITESLVLVWAVNNKGHIVPAEVKHINYAKLSEADIGSNPNIIGDTSSVKFLSLPGSPALKGKVDTGADICSLHADKWAIQGDKVHFTCPKLSPNSLSLPLHNHQAVRSASGTQYRPVIELNIKLNDKIMQNVLFNLADRGDMEFPVLIGRNVLEKGKFLIDPSLKEELDWVYIEKLVEGIKAPETQTITESVSKQDIENVYKVLSESGLTFADIVSYIRTETIKTMEEIEY